LRALFGEPSEYAILKAIERFGVEILA